MSSPARVCVAIALLASAAATAAGPKPRAAILISRASYARNRDATQMSGKGWAGIANLAGIPYDTLLLDEIAAQNLSRYRLLVFAQCSSLEEKLLPMVTDSLGRYLAAGGNLIVDGPLAIFDDSGKERDHARLDSLLGIEYRGRQGNSNYRIKAASIGHFVTRPFENGQFLTQPLAGALSILGFKEGGETLLVSSDGKQTYPFLSCRAARSNRIALFSDLTTPAGATAFFRNHQPEGFYANRLPDAAVRAVYWTAYGDIRGPFPAAQTTNANLAAIGRLDGDVSSNFDYQAQTLKFWIKTARDSGVVPVYAFVSDGAAKTGWERLAPFTKELQALGGAVGSHSKTHGDYFDTRVMTDGDWEKELDGSVSAIESGLKTAGAPVPKLDMFINPGNGILMEHYEQIARRFALMMTHGAEIETPVAFGNLTWFTGPHKNLVVVDNAPAPDWAWFYEPDWNYSAAQIASSQETIFDHMFHNIGRSVIFSLMWHDYSIADPPLTLRRKPNRILDTFHMPLYEGVAAKWATSPIYCPEPADLANKLRAMAQWDYSWKSEANRIEIELDLSALRLKESVDYTGGMGIRIENTGERIQTVTINGRPHFGFDDRIVILPNLEPEVNRIAVTLGPGVQAAPHVTYVSKRMPFTRSNSRGMEFRLLTRSKARFSVTASEPAVLLHADSQEWDRKGDRQLHGYVNSDRTLVWQRTRLAGFAVTRATLPVTALSEGSGRIALTLAGSGVDRHCLRFRSARGPKTVLFGGRRVEVSRSGPDFEISLPPFQGATELHIQF